MDVINTRANTHTMAQPGEHVQIVQLRLLIEGYEQARSDGLCVAGAWEVARQRFAHEELVALFQICTFFSGNYDKSRGGGLSELDILPAELWQHVTLKKETSAAPANKRNVWQARQ